MYLSDKQVAERYGVKRETIWKWARELPDFPKQVKLTPGCTRWRVAELVQWERDLPRAVAAESEVA